MFNLNNLTHFKTELRSTIVMANSCFGDIETVEKISNKIKNYISLEENETLVKDLELLLELQKTTDVEDIFQKIILIGILLRVKMTLRKAIEVYVQTEFPESEYGKILP